MRSSKEAIRAHHTIPSFCPFPALRTVSLNARPPCGHLKNAAPLHRLGCGAVTLKSVPGCSLGPGGVGPVGGTLRLDPAGAGSRAALGGISRHAVRPAPSACPARPAAPPRPTPSARRRAHGGRLRSAAASLGTPWPGRAGGRAGTRRAWKARAGGRELQVGTTETDQGHASHRVRLTQDGVDFLGIASPRNNPDAQKRTAGFGTSRASLEVSSSPSFRAPPAEGAAGSLV